MNYVGGLLPSADGVLLFHPTVLFLTQRRMQISETLKLNIAKGLTQALRKAFHQNDVLAHVSPLFLKPGSSSHVFFLGPESVYIASLLPGHHNHHGSRIFPHSSFWQIVNVW